MSFVIRNNLCRIFQQPTSWGTLSKFQHFVPQRTLPTQPHRLFSTCLCRYNALLLPRKTAKIFRVVKSSKNQRTFSRRGNKSDIEDTVYLGFSSLRRPFGFTVFVCVGSFLGATILQYEHLRYKVKRARNVGHMMDDYYGKAGRWRQKLNELWKKFSQGEKVGAFVVALNVAVFLGWRVQALQPIMERFFLCSPIAKSVCLPMVLSTFSHVSPWHLAVNMYVLWSFCPTVVHTMGVEQFAAFYISAGVISSFTSLAFKIATKRYVPSVGASGAILGLLGFVGSMYPDAQLSIVFIDHLYPHSFSAEKAIYGIMGFDIVGCILRLGLFDHAAHLGGILFGMWYHKYGNYYIWKKREKLVKTYHEFRGQP